MASTSPARSSSNPTAWRAVREAPAAWAWRTSSRAPRASMESTRASMARVERLAFHDQADEQGRVAGLGRPQGGAVLVGGWFELTRLEELEGAHDAAAVGRVDLLRGPGRRPRRASCMAAPARHVRRPPARGARGPRDRAAGQQLEVGQRRLQVEAGAADHDRAPSCPPAPRRSRRGRARRTRRRRTCPLEVDERQQAVLELGLPPSSVAAPVSVSRPR